MGSRSVRATNRWHWNAREKARRPTVETSNDLTAHRSRQGHQDPVMRPVEVPPVKQHLRPLAREPIKSAKEGTASRRPSTWHRGIVLGDGRVPSESRPADLTQKVAGSGGLAQTRGGGTDADVGEQLLEDLASSPNPGVLQSDGPAG